MTAVTTVRARRSLAGALIAASGRRPWHIFDRGAREARRSQEAVLAGILRQNAASEFGRAHRFAAINGSEEYRRRVPIGDYETHRPYVEQAAAGKPGMLTAAPPLMFSSTSGSTGAPKLIPVTRASARASGALGRSWLYRAQQDHPGLFRGKVVSVVSPAEEGRTEAGIPYGSASGQIYRDTSRWLRRTYAVPYEVFTIPDYDTKYYAIMRFAIAHDVSFLATANPSTIRRLVELANQRAPDLAQDIRDGTLCPDAEIPSSIRSALRPHLYPDRERALALERLREAHGFLAPRHYWPNLVLLGCWLGGTVGYQAAPLQEWFGPAVPLRDLGYLSSEARASLPVADGTAAGILAVNANFYEFRLPEDLDSDADTLLCDEVEVGRDYYILLTTPGGLYRYDINDVVRVVAFHHGAPVIEFVQKGREVTNLTGEKLYASQVIAAVQQAAAVLPVQLVGFRAVADIAESRYRLLAELTESCADAHSLRRFLLQVDGALADLNMEYREKRKSGRLGSPVLHVMPSGWHDAERAAAIARGVRDTQLKSLVVAYLSPGDTPLDAGCAIEAAEP